MSALWAQVNLLKEIAALDIVSDKLREMITPHLKTTKILTRLTLDRTAAAELKAAALEAVRLHRTQAVYHRVRVNEFSTLISELGDLEEKETRA